MTRAQLELLQWFALLGGPLAWATQQVVGFGIADAGCRRWDLHLSVAQIALAAAAGAIVVAAEAAALVVFRATSDAGPDAPGPRGRLHFLAQAALLGNVLFFIVVVLSTVGAVYHLPCSGS
jgi:hypothetical protein